MTDSDHIIIPKITRRIVDAGCDILEVGTDTPEYLHSVLCQVGLPRSKVAGRTFSRSSGRASMLLEAGQLATPHGNWIEAPLPYGTKPRLVLYHLCSEAVRTRSPHIDTGGSIREFLDRIGIARGGRAEADFKKQMVALSACRMTLGIFDGQRVTQAKVDPVHTFDAWLSKDPQQKAFWSDEIRLGQEFFDTLLEHAVPLDPRAIHALQHSALCMDIYTWLAHRLCRIRKADGVKLSWRNLKEQFGQEYGISKDFKKAFRAALFKVRAVYPTADIEDAIGGLILKPSPPPIPKTSVLVSLPKSKPRDER